MKKVTFGISVLSLLLLSSAFAQDISDSESAAWTEAYEMLSEYMDAQAVSKMTLVAYHLTAEQLCDDVHTDSNKINEAITAVRPSNYHDLPASSREHWNQAFLGNFGLVMGVMLAEHAGEGEAFCNEVRAVIADEDSTWDYFDHEFADE